MKEESQIEDMRKALQGDRERADQARRRSLASMSSPVEKAATDPGPPHRPRQSVLGNLFRRR